MNGVPDLGNLQGMAQEYLSKMTPEQMEEIRKTVENLSDEEKKNLLQMFAKNIDPNKLWSGAPETPIKIFSQNINPNK